MSTQWFGKFTLPMMIATALVAMPFAAFGQDAYVEGNVGVTVTDGTFYGNLTIDGMNGPYVAGIVGGDAIQFVYDYELLFSGDNSVAGTPVMSLGNITTGTNGVGSVVFGNLTGSTLSVGNIGTGSNKLASLTTGSTGSLSFQNIYVENTTIGQDLFLVGGNLGILQGTSDVSSSGNLTIEGTDSAGFAGKITAAAGATLTIVDGKFLDQIRSFGNHIHIVDGVFDGRIIGAETIDAGTFNNAVAGGLLTIYSGTFTQDIGALHLTIYGGEFRGLVDSQDDVIVSGGTFFGAVNSGATLKKIGAGTVTLGNVQTGHVNVAAGTLEVTNLKLGVAVVPAIIQVDSGAELKATATTIDFGSGNLQVTGDGVAYLGAVSWTTPTGWVTIGNSSDSTKVGIDVVASNFGTHTVYVTDNAVLGVYGGNGLGLAAGETKDYTTAEFAWLTFETTPTDQAALDALVEDWDKFGTWTFYLDGSASFQAAGGTTPGGPFVVDMNDGFVGAMMMHNRFAAWNAVRDKMISGNGYGNGIYRGQSYCDPCDAVSCDPCDAACGPAFSGTRSAWVNYTGRNDRYRSSFNDRNWKLSAEGIQVGSDLYRSRSGQFGLLFSYEGGKMYNDVALGISSVALNRDWLKADDSTVGFYGARVLRGGADVRGSFAFGWQDYDMLRNDFDGAYASSFKGRTTEINLEIGKRLAAGAWSLRPVAGLDIYNNNLKAATEAYTGTSTGVLGVAYDKTSLTQAFARFGTDLRYRVKCFTFNSGLYYAYDMHGQKLKVGVSDGTNAGILYGSQLGRELIMANLGMEFNVSDNLSLLGGYEGQYTLDGATKSAMNVGYVGAGFKF